MHNRMPTRNDGTRRLSTPRETTGAFQRAANSIRDNLVLFCFGIFLVCVATGILFWNEGRAVQSSKSLDEAASVVHSLPSSNFLSEKNNGQLVHFTGHLRTSTPLRDFNYSISVHVVKLKRTVEMYQWVETEHKREVQELERIRTDISYSYSKEWKTEMIDSDSFDIRPGHYNPKARMIEPLELVADQVQVGKFFLSKNLIDKVKDYKQLMPSQVPANLQSLVIVRDGIFYHSENPLEPQIGDLRVTFEYAGYSGEQSHRDFGEPDMVSVIGRQEPGHIIGSYKTLFGDEIELIYMGEHTSQAMFATERASNALLTWALRLLGWLLMFISFGCMSNIVTVFVDWMPVIRDAVHLGVNSLNAVLAISCSLVVIAFGWLWYRPLLGFLILFVASLPYLLLARTRPSTTRTDYRE